MVCGLSAKGLFEEIRTIQRSVIREYLCCRFVNID